MTQNKTRSLRIALIGLLVALMGSPSGASALRAQAGARLEPITLLVRMHKGLSEEEVREGLGAKGMRVRRRIPGIDVWVVEDVEGLRASAASANLVRDSDVVWAEPNGRVHALGIAPTDTFYAAQQWNLRRIGLPEAWVFTRGDVAPIAVIDTGVDLDHPDLTAKIWTNGDEVAGNGEDDDGNGYVDDVHGWNFVPSPDGNPNPEDDHRHGSHVAGIVAADTDNGTGVAGVSWQSNIMPLKVLDQTGEGRWDDVLEAIVYAADNGARVLNLSLGGSPDDSGLPLEAMQLAVSYARSKGCLILAAAGNSEDQPAQVLYPAALPDVLAIGATTEDDTAWRHSNRGPEVDVSAPGVSVFSTTPNGGYATMSGTSMATPHVSGLAALLWAFEPSLTVAGVTHVITSTAEDVHTVGYDEHTGWGRVDAQAAVLRLAQPQIDLVASPPSVLVGEQTAAITATVTYSQSLSVPDGLSVLFASSLGQIDPAQGMTREGQATGVFSPTSQFGEALIAATVSEDVAATVVVEVVPHRCHLPIVWNHLSSGPQ